MTEVLGLLQEHEIWTLSAILAGIVALGVIYTTYFTGSSTDNSTSVTAVSNIGGSTNTNNNITTSGDNSGTNSIDQSGNPQPNLPANPMQAQVTIAQINPSLGYAPVTTSGLNAQGIPTELNFSGSGCTPYGAVSIHCSNSPWDSVITTSLTNISNDAASYTTTCDGSGSFNFTCSLLYMMTDFSTPANLTSSNYNPIMQGGTYNFYVVDKTSGVPSPSNAITLTEALQ